MRRMREACAVSITKELADSDDMVGREKYEHRLQEAFNFTRHEIAILCELLLRALRPGGFATRGSHAPLTTWASCSHRNA